MKVLKGCPKINTLPLKFGNLKSDGLASPIQVLDGQNIFDISDLCYFWPMNSSREEFGTSEEVSALPRLGYCTKKLQASGPPKLSTTLLQISSNHSTVQEETTKLSTTGGLKMSAGRVVSQRSHGNADYGKRVQLEEMIKIELTQDLNGYYIHSREEKATSDSILINAKERTTVSNFVSFTLSDNEYDDIHCKIANSNDISEDIGEPLEPSLRSALHVTGRSGSKVKERWHSKGQVSLPSTLNKVRESSTKRSTKPHKSTTFLTNHFCKICLLVFPTVARRNAHMKLHRANYQCKFCGRNICSEGQLFRHFEKVHHLMLVVPELEFRRISGRFQITATPKSINFDGSSAVDFDRSQLSNLLEVSQVKKNEPLSSSSNSECRITLEISEDQDEIVEINVNAAESASDVKSEGATAVSKNETLGTNEDVESRSEFCRGLEIDVNNQSSAGTHPRSCLFAKLQDEKCRMPCISDNDPLPAGPAKASLLNKRRLLSAHRPTHKRRLRGGKRNIRLAKDKTTRRVIGEILTTKKITRLDILNDENTEFEVSMNCRSSKATSTETPTGKLSPYQFNCDLKPKISKPGVDCSNWSDELFAREHINKESKSVEFDQNLILKERTPGCVTSSDKIGIQPPSKEDGVQQTTYNLRSRQIYLNKQTENKIKRISASSEALTKANNNVLFPDNFADRKVETNATGEESMESPYPPKQLCSVKIMESLGKVTHSIPEAKRGLKFHINASDDNKCAESSHAIKYLPAMKKSRTKSRPAIVKRISLSIQDSVSRLRAMKQGQVVLESDTPLVTSSYKQFRKKDKRYPCPCPHTGCPRVMASKNALRYHLETHMKLSFPCQMCGKIFGHKLSLNNHMLVHQKPTFECPRCDRKFRKNFPLQRHIQETHQRRPVHECQICAQKFVTYREMYCHRKKHDNRGGRCFFCNVCRTGFTRKTHLATHVTQHSARPDTRFMYRCNYCSDLIVFRTYMSVKLHCLQLHPNDQLPTAFECRLWVVKGTDLVRDNLKMRLPQPQDNFEDDFSFSDRPGAVSRYHQGSVEAFGNEGDIYSSHIETKYMAEAPHRENSRQAPRVIYLAEGSAVNVALDSSVTANVPGVEGIQVGSPVDRSSKSVKPRTIFPNRKMDDELCYINSSSYGKSEMERTFDVFDSPTHVCGETLSRAYFDVPNSSADPVNTADVSSKTDISPIQPADSKFCCFDVGPSDIPMSDVYVDLENSFVGQNVEVPFALDEPEYFLDGKISDTLNSYNGTDRNSVKVDPFLDFWDTESSETTSFDGSGLALENSSFCDDDKSFESGYASGCASYITP